MLQCIPKFPFRIQILYRTVGEAHIPLFIPYPYLYHDCSWQTPHIKHVKDGEIPIAAWFCWLDPREPPFVLLKNHPFLMVFFAQILVDEILILSVESPIFQGTLWCVFPFKMGGFPIVFC